MIECYDLSIIYNLFWKKYQDYFENFFGFIDFIKEYIFIFIGLKYNKIIEDSKYSGKENGHH